MKLAIISGGSKGLGAALLEQYREAGYTVRELSRSGQTAASVHIDLADLDNTLEVAETLFDELASESWEEILFYNNAGLVKPIGRVSGKEVDDVIDNINVNYTSAILLMREFVRAFQAHDCPKTIVNITSGAADRAMHGWSLYCAAKAGIEHFVRTVALEQKEEAHPIAAVNISPGIVDTGMQADIREATAEDFPSVDRFRSFKEEGDLRSPETVATTIRKILASNVETGGRYAVADYV